jgi:hypothetical protein
MADPTNVPTGESNEHDEVIVRATVSRLVITTKAPVELVESVVRDELERRRGSARIQTFVPILTERAARRRLKREYADIASDALHPGSAGEPGGEPNEIRDGPTEPGPG